jgi:uncharacterized protein with LGFP repeats
MGTWAVSGAVRTYYFSTGGSLGWLGWPTSDASCKTDACSQSFQFGTVYSKGGSARLGLPAIEALAQARAAELGARVSELDFLGAGYGQAYVNGSIYSSALGTWAVTGGIRTFYFTLGGATGSLGWPAGDATCSTDTCTQVFQGGTVYWSQATGGRLGLGAIEAYVAAHQAQLGARVTGVVPITANGGGFGQAFALGSVYSSSAGTWSVYGGIRSTYFASGGAAGPQGWPAADAVCTATACSQTFTGGTLYWTSTEGGRLGLPAIETYAAAHPELGVRSSGLIRIDQNGGGFGQVYAAASVYSSASGTWAVTGGIRTVYFSRSGAAGPLGWPTADRQCDAAGMCTQTFQGGTVTGTK